VTADTEGDFLLRALTDLIAQSRGRIHQLEHEFEEPEKLAAEREIPRDVLQTIHHMARRQRILGVSEAQLRERVNHLQELHILREHRVQSSLQDPEGPGEASA
jgi:hypothetical protein